MAAHPIVIALLIQAASVLGMSAISMSTPPEDRLDLNKPNSPYWHLFNLSSSAQGIAIAAATVPVVAGGLNLIGGALEAYAARKPT